MAFLISNNLNAEEQTVFTNFKRMLPEYNFHVHYMTLNLGQKLLDINIHEWRVMVEIIRETHDEIFAKERTLLTHIGTNAEEREKLLPWIKEGLKDVVFADMYQKPEYTISKEASEVIAYLLSRFQQDRYWSSSGYWMDATIDGVQYSISSSDTVVRTDEAMTLKWWMVRMQIARYCMFFEGRHGFTIINPRKG